jgi:hypothetical protein
MTIYIVKVAPRSSRIEDKFVRIDAPNRATAKAKLTDNPYGMMPTEVYTMTEYIKYKWEYGNFTVNAMIAGVSKFVQYASLTPAQKSKVASYYKKSLIPSGKFISGKLYE